jgi:hypothetical protein
VLGFVVFASWLACQLFAGRAAFLLVGAMLATAMSANVFFWIIPGQRTVVAQLRAGQPVDPVHGQRGKQRSVHNTYFTLPVIVAMLSNHYGWLYHGPAQLAGAGAADAGRRADPPQLRGPPQGACAGPRTPWEHAVAGTLVLMGLALWMAPPPPSAQARAAPAQPATTAQVKPWCSSAA